MKRHYFLLLPLTLLAALPAFSPLQLRAQPKDDPTVRKTNEPPAFTVTRGTLKPKAQVDAVIEALEMTPIKLEPKAWTDLTVLEAVPHGTRVKQGDVLVKLDTDKLREQVEELEQDRPAGALTMELAVADLKNVEQTTPYRLEAARRTQRVTGEDLATFERIGRAQREKAARFGVKSAEQRLEGALEELKQLKKMYEADDLTEETEEIVLKRQKNQVEWAEYGLDSARQIAEQSLKTTIPREYETFKAGARDSEAALALADETLPRTLAKKRSDLEKLKRDQRKADKKFADLKQDLETLEVRAPKDGIVYYGTCEGGKWTTGAQVARKLVPTGKLLPNEIFMTVVNPDRLILRATIAEADLGNVKPGLAGKAAPVSAPDKKLETRLDELGFVPLPGGGFDARLSLKRDRGVHLVPGMNCKVTLGEGAANALLVPKEAVFTENGESFVIVLPAGGKPEKRSVKIGDSDGKLVEITSGLTEGERISPQKP